MMVLDDSGRVLAHSPDYELWLGRDLSDQSFVRDALRRHQGSEELISADGVSRLSAYTTATRAPWLVRSRPARTSTCRRSPTTTRPPRQPGVSPSSAQWSWCSARCAKPGA